jgi:uncharacterized LabA/DUF88 family protein
MAGGQRVVVYIDGFNLYYGCLQSTPYRWLDLGEFCAQMLPQDNVVRIKYFTALVGPRPWRPKKSQAQEIYLRALQTVPTLSVHLGHFLTFELSARLVKPPSGTKSAFRKVWKTEEKGSDVNLASHLLIDGFRERYDLAVVVSNDSDLKEPVEFVRHDLQAPVGVLNPHGRRSWALSPEQLPLGSFYKPIRPGALAASQFPPTMTDRKGTFSRPPGW